MTDKWVVKKFEQSMRHTPVVVDQITFNDEKAAIEFYQRNRRIGNWPWTFWAYPEKAVVPEPARYRNKCPLYEHEAELQYCKRCEAHDCKDRVRLTFIG